MSRDTVRSETSTPSIRSSPSFEVNLVEQQTA